MLATIRGRVWKFGDDIDTDSMAPFHALTQPPEVRKRTMFPARPEFAQQVQAGEIIVAGRNFGCGSSREQAPENLRLAGIAAVVAESFARIYFRNGIAMGFPQVVCPGIAAACEEGHIVEIDLEAAMVTNLSAITAGAPVTLQARAYAAPMLAILRAGGLMALLQSEAKARA